MDGHVIAAATRARFSVVVSSAAVYGDRAPARARFEERAAPAPGNAYGRAKLEQEQRWRAALPAERLLVARLFNLTGPGEPPTQAARAFADRLRAAAPGETVGVRQSESLRDFLDVRDAGDALAELVGAGVGGTVNVCSGVPVSVADLAARMVRVSGLGVRLDLDGQGGESRSVGDPGELERRVAWRPRRGLDDSLSAIWAEAASITAGTS
jgi:nucleoside-diphosphate-sugar epimerase